MNWIIVSTKENLDLYKNVKIILEKNSAHCECCNYEDIEHLDKSYFFNEKFLEANYFIFLLDNKKLDNLQISFILGFAIGKQLSVFLLDENNSFNNKFENLITFTNVDELTSLLNKNLPSYIANEKTRIAHKKLFQMGIPFTPDCFSFEIAKNNVEVCNLFLEAGMDINSRDSAGTPPICAAARSGKKEMVEWLINKGADVDAVSKDRGYSAVMDAVWKADVDMVTTLIKHGANLNFISRDGQNSLILATGNGRIPICKVLIKNGADPLAKDHMGMSAYDYAKLFKKDELLSLYSEYIK